MGAQSTDTLTLTFLSLLSLLHTVFVQLAFLFFIYSSYFPSMSVCMSRCKTMYHMSQNRQQLSGKAYDLKR